MSSAPEILVIILLVVLIIFLILGIVLMTYAIVLTFQIRRIAKSAEEAVNNFGAIFVNALKLLSPKFIASVVDGVVQKFKTKTEKSKAKKEEEEQ